MLLAIKSVLKELIPIVDKPALQYLVEGAVSRAESGHHDRYFEARRFRSHLTVPELEDRLKAGRRRRKQNFSKP